MQVVNVPTLLARGLLSSEEAAAATNLLARLAAVRAADSSAEQQAQLSALRSEVDSVNKKIGSRREVQSALHADVDEVRLPTIVW